MEFTGVGARDSGFGKPVEARGNKPLGAARMAVVPDIRVPSPEPRRVSVPSAPPRACRGPGNGAAALGAEGGGAGGAAFEAAETAERGGVRVRFVRERAARDDPGPLGRRLAASTGRPDVVGAFGLGDLLHEIADQAAALDGEEGGRGVPPDA